MNQPSLSSVRQISKNSLFLLVARAIDFLSQIAIIPIVARYLGAESYGDYGYVMAFAFITTSFTYMGLERITMREIAKNPSDAGKYLGAGIIARWIYMGLAIALTTVIVLAMDLSPKIILSICVASLALNFTADTFIYLAMFKAFDKMRYETLLASIFQCFNFGFVFLVSYFRLGFVAFFIGLLAANFLRYMAAMAIASRKFTMPDYKNGLPLIKPLLKESYILGLVSLIIQGFVNVDILILKALKNTFEVAMFYAPHNLLILMSVVPISIMSGFFPSLSRSAGADARLLVYKYEKVFRIFAIVGIFLAAMCIVFANKIILIFYGQEFLGAIPAFQILAASLIFTMLFSVVDFTLVAVKRQHVLIWCFLCGLIIRAALDLVLIPRYGYMGASVAALSGYVIIFAIGFSMLSRYTIFLPLHRVILKPVFVVGVIGLCLSQFNQGNIYLLSLIGFVLYLLCLWGLKSFLPDEMDFFKRAMQKAAGVSLKNS